MFLSCLMINVGEDPDRPRPGRAWIRNRYRVHQRLCMAFPSDKRRNRDTNFLKPYDPAQFAVGHVHTPRSRGTGFLFRVDPRAEGRPVILVQSAARPDWDYAFHNADFLLDAPPQVRETEANFGKGEALRFRLQANPVRRVTEKSAGPDGEPLGPEWLGKRVPVPHQDLAAWLGRRLTKAGARQADLAQMVPGYVYFSKQGRGGRWQRLYSVRYDGLLEVTDPDRFTRAVAAGIGPAKAFGFGLLSVARV